MASQNLVWPSSASHAAYSTDLEWTNPTNVAADDGTYATAAVSNAVAAKGDKFGNWGWDAIIPAGAAITDVQLEYQYKQNTAGLVTMHAFARIGGTDLADHTDTSSPTVDTTIGPSSIFSDRAWTRADLLDGTFEFVLRATNASATSRTVSADYIAVTVVWSVSSVALAKPNFIYLRKNT